MWLFQCFDLSLTLDFVISWWSNQSILCSSNYKYLSDVFDIMINSSVITAGQYF